MGIEFLWNEELCTDPTSPCDLIYFPKPAIASALSPKSKMKLMEEVDFDNQDGKLRDFMERAHALVEEMKYIYYMSNLWKIGPLPAYPIFNFLTANYLNIKQFAFMLVVLLNIVYAVSVEGPGNAMRTTFASSQGDGNGVTATGDDFGNEQGSGFWGTYDYGFNQDGPRSDFFGFWFTKSHPGNTVNYDDGQVTWDMVGAVTMANGNPFYTAYLVVILTLAIVFLYTTCTAYLLISQLPLIAHGHISNQADVLAEKFKESLTGVAKLDYFQFDAFTSWGKATFFYLLMGIVFYVQYWEFVSYDTPYVRVNGTETDELMDDAKTWPSLYSSGEPVSLETYNTRKWMIQCYCGFFGAVFGPLFLKCYRRAVDTCTQYQYSVLPKPKPGSALSEVVRFFITDPFAAFNKYYCIGYDAATDQDQFMNIVFNLFAFLSLHRFYYASMCLLDIVTISPGLKSTIKAVTEPILDLLEVLMLMIFVVFVFTVYGLYFFGQYYGTNLDDGMV